MSLFEKIAFCDDPYDLDRRAYSRALEFWKAAGSAPGALCAAAVQSASPAQDEADAGAPPAPRQGQEGWLESWLESAASAASSRRIIKSAEPSREMVALEHEWGSTMLILNSGRAASGGARFIPDFKLSMLRFSPAPAYLVQDPAPLHEHQGPVLIAMNVATPDDRFMRDMHKFLMRRARELATAFNAQVHLVNAVRPVSNPYPGDLVGLAPEILGERLRRECFQNLMDFASHYGIPDEHCHVIDGIPEEVVPNLCHALRPACLVMASSGRSGIAGSIIGNVPEAIMRRVDCDMLIVPEKCLKYQKMD